MSGFEEILVYCMCVLCACMCVYMCMCTHLCIYMYMCVRVHMCGGIFAVSSSTIEAMTTLH